MSETTAITPCLWFDNQAEQAAEFYTSVFPDSKVTEISRYGDVGPGEPGSVMTVSFELRGQSFTALNGGPIFTFSEAISFQISCEDQQEVDYFWDALIAGGGEPSQCGWLKDRFGVSWQVIPQELFTLLSLPDAEAAQRATAAMLSMQKLDIEVMRRAAAGEAVSG
jgi:predicted 3-demethylubiquinone-9 3-methyltransferase (glyoxalase superfamily)